jgi:Undecaprenyl-phosphate galactose phosphotransferase WbaP
MESDLELRVLPIGRPDLRSARGRVFQGHVRAWHTVALFFSDVLAFSLAGLLAIATRVVFGDIWRFDLLLQLIPVFALCAVFYSFVGLYPATGVSPVEELRRLSTTTSIVVLSFAAVSFWARNAQDFSRLTLALTWIYCLFLLPVNRQWLRALGVHLNVWGEPVAILGNAQRGQWAVDFFQRNRKLGLRPVVILDVGQHVPATSQSPTLRIKDLTLAQELGKLVAVETVLIVMSDVSSSALNKLTRNRQAGFKRLILIPNLEQISSYGAVSLDFGGVLGLEVRHNLLEPSHRLTKRIMDFGLALIGGILISPFLLMVAIGLAIESRGPVFFRHVRIGKDGRKFATWKFRTMVVDADARLRRHLEAHPESREEWEQNRKLKDDPRTTRLGRLLRRFSVDELPQLWNVLLGDMSLVGPRPIVAEEIPNYGALFESYTWVHPGMTGLWQVSGRSNTGYDERVRLDEYYVRNWSIWLDLHILARTIAAVLRKEGAY